ncbi:MAG: nuclear transport factor 2 family protein [Bacteroidota bacterium]
MNEVEKLAHQFYQAFQKKEYAKMANCYHEELIFNDPVFRNLNKKMTSKMWEMLLKRGKDLEIDYEITQQTENEVKVHWTAHYTFSQTGKPVINEIDANLKLKDGLIHRHTDVFNFHKWSSQALGMTGKLLGWTSFLQNSIQKRATISLEKYINRS